MYKVKQNEGDPFENLAIAIVVLAVQDYKNAVRYLARGKNKNKLRESERTKSDCERFFKSDWFEELTGLDRDVFFKEINKKIVNDSR